MDLCYECLAAELNLLLALRLPLLCLLYLQNMLNFQAFPVHFRSLITVLTLDQAQCRDWLLLFAEEADHCVWTGLFRNRLDIGVPGVLNEVSIVHLDILAIVKHYWERLFRRWHFRFGLWFWRLRGFQSFLLSEVALVLASLGLFNMIVDPFLDFLECHPGLILPLSQESGSLCLPAFELLL